ncbi:putative baseplate assembly protein [Methanobacterium formicicum]|uniref:putative baseplate assembly protein n=1 Tax=Methanobacterium formicicum TaxID=2162 RepID=UPI002412E74F|nr:putative baseplate assembly protein [Methanobacterium formicicum]MDG3548140.1 putative baseplate assembly protein [Methanobacterium formicicum]
MSLPIPDLDDKTFKDLVEDAKRLIPTYVPEWTDYNAHDPGITLIELFAWLTEMQIYQLNKITEENKLKFLKLLGVEGEPAKPAKVDVTFSLKDAVHPVRVDKNTQIATIGRKTEENIVFETLRSINVVPMELKQITSQYNQEFVDNTPSNNFDNHFYHAFGEKAEKGSMLYLGFDKSFPDEIIDLSVYLYENDLIERGKHGKEKPNINPSANVKWEYYKNGFGWVKLEISRDETYVFNFNGLISFKTPPDMEKTNLTDLDVFKEYYWIRCIVIKSGFEIPPRIDSIRLNIVPAIHGETVNEEIHISNGLPDQTFSLNHKPVIARSMTVSFLNDKLKGKWKEVKDFYASGPEDLHYVIDHDEAEITLGNGVNGQIPDSGTEIKVNYRFGGGVKGNVKEGVIQQILNPQLNMLGVKNEGDAQGGFEKESVKNAIIRAKKELNEPYQAVTSSDYEYLARSTPGLRVRRAKAIPNKENGSVVVVVVPESTLNKPQPSENFLKTVKDHLNEHRLITTDIQVKAPEYVGISVNALLDIKKGYNSENVQKKVENTLNSFINPLNGGFDGKGWPFGHNVLKSEIYSHLIDIDGVNYILKLSIESREYAYKEDKIEIPEYALVFSKKHEIEVVERKEKYWGEVL